MRFAKMNAININFLEIGSEVEHGLSKRSVDVSLPFSIREIDRTVSLEDRM